MKLSKKAKAAIKKYGRESCVYAHSLSELGYGANTIAYSFPVANVNTTRQADAAIDAGRELKEQS
jgi:hypothetical protein